jgi:phosphoribosylglycinamide formyltransferase-1
MPVAHRPGVPARPRGARLGHRLDLQALLDACTDPAYGAQVVAVGSDRPGVEGSSGPGRSGVPTFVRQVSAAPSRPTGTGS